MLLFTSVMLCSVLPLLQAKQITVCDCTEAKNAGILKFSDGDCDLDKKARAVNFTRADYEVYTTRRAAVKFPAYICGRWKLVRRNYVNLFFSVISVPDRVPLETTATECLIMQQGRRCGENPMKYEDGKWTYIEEPSREGSWLRTIELYTINCVLEEVVLTQEEEGGNISTPSFLFTTLP